MKISVLLQFRHKGCTNAVSTRSFRLPRFNGNISGFTLPSRALKRQSLVVAVLLAAGAATADAQDVSVSVGVAVVAAVIAPPEVEDPPPVQVDPSQNTSVSPGAPGSPVRTLQYNYDVTVSFVTVPVLSNGSGGSLPISTTCAYKTDVGTYSTPVACDVAVWGAGIFDVSSSSASRDVAVGYAILASDLAGRPAGTYAGKVTIVMAPR